VPLDETFPQTVVFVIASRKKNGQVVRMPIGTGFIVSVPSQIEGSMYLYAVTASHVIASGEETWLRFNREDGRTFDVPVAEWFSLDPSADVAVTPVSPMAGLRWAHVPLAQFLDSRRDLSPSLGDDVYFVGLLANMRTMADENIPMVRSGTLGRMSQREVPLRRSDGTIFRITGHLIDCRSFSGFSGSPCFVQFTYLKRVHTPSVTGGMIGDLEHTATLLLGLISGHWEDPQEAHPKDAAFQVGTFEYAINTGVGVVTPVELIRTALDLEELVQKRRDADDERRRAESGGDS
jgi:hypothetical protein